MRVLEVDPDTTLALVLCSDGVSDVVEKESLLDVVVQADTAAEAAEAVLERAREAVEMREEVPDDATCVVWVFS